MAKWITLKGRIVGRKMIGARFGWCLSLLVLTTFLLPSITYAQAYAQIKSYQEISPEAGGFTGVIEEGDLFGESCTGLGDLDGDSIPDIAISAEGDDDGGDDTGAIYILFLNSDGTVKSQQKISNTEGGLNGALPVGSRLGDHVVAIGDLDDDGTMDIAAGAQGDDDGGRNFRAVWIFFLNSNGTVKGYQKISALEGGFSSTQPIGSKVAGIGDVNLDGIPDIAVGSSNIDDGGPRRGGVWILCLNRDGTVKLQQKISDTDGNFTGVLDDQDLFGHDVAGLGDLDGDGVPDIGVMSQYDDDGAENAGAVWILFLNTDGTVKSHQKISATEGNFTDTLHAWDAFGEAMAPLGDLNGDGVPDIVVGDDYFDDAGANNGAVWIMYLNPDSTVAYWQRISNSTPGFTGVLYDGYEFGNEASNIGDVNGDGVADLLVTSNTSNVGVYNSGSAFVFFLEGLEDPPGGGKGVYQQSDANGIVSMEAENADMNLTQGGHVWVPAFSAGYSGPGAMQAEPNTGANNDTSYVTISPRLDYVVNFVKTGTHYVWLRGIGANVGDDSVHVGLDGAESATSDRMSSFNSSWTWSKNTMDGPVATINVTSAGVHTVNVWMREDGFVLDKLVLTDNPSYTPTGTGPAESPRGNSLVFSPNVLTFTVAEDGSAPSQDTVLSTSDLGVASYTIGVVSEGSDWLLVTPTSGDTDTQGTLTVSIDAAGLSPGTYTGTITATSSDGYADDTVDVTLTVTGAPFQQNPGTNGIVSIETENFYLNASREGHDWVQVFPADYSGTGAMQALPNTGANNDTGYVTNSPRLDYVVNFVKTGIHYVWIRGIGANGNDDSVHVGLDGVGLTTSDRMSSFNSSWTWSKSTMDGPVATINVTSAGVHTVNVWMREDGFVLDKLVLTDNPSYTPTGTGPAESPRGNSLVFSPNVLTFTVEEGGSAPSQDTVLSTSDLGNASYTIGVVSEGSDWLLVTPTSGDTDTQGTLTVSIDAAGLSSGTYTGTITATSGDGYVDDTVDVTLYVTAVSVPELVFTPNVLTFTVEEGGSAPSQNTVLSTSDLGNASYAIGVVSEGSDWLLVTPTSGNTDTQGTLTVSIDATGLSSGTYTGTITATSGDGYTDGTVDVTLFVTSSGTYDLLLSSSPDRSNPVSLEGKTVSGAIYVFTGPDTGVSRVSFYLDDPDMSGSPIKVEGYAPYDFAGTAGSDAYPFDTGLLLDGSHEITALIEFDGGGSELHSSTFRVANNAPALVFSPNVLTFTVEEGGSAPSQNTVLSTSDLGNASYAIGVVSEGSDWLLVTPTSGNTDTQGTLTVSIDATGLSSGTYTGTITATSGDGYTDGTVDVTLFVTSSGTYDLLLSSSPDRSNPVSLGGETVSGAIYVFTGPDTGVSRVSFYLDDPDMSGSPIKVESYAPYDFAGTAGSNAYPFDTIFLSNDSHTITALIELTAGGVEVVNATFTVNN